MPNQKSKLCRYKSHNTQRKNHKRPSVLVVVSIQIDTNPYLISRAANRKSTNMELALDMDLSCKMYAASEHNRKRERLEIEEERQTFNHQAKLRSNDKENMTALGRILTEIRKSGCKSAAHLIKSNTALAIFTSENKVRIAAHLICSNTALATLAS